MSKLSAVEVLKSASHGLRGNLAAELAEGGIQVSEDAYQLLKFHGSYEQFDRDTATDRKQHGLEKEYQFMLRCRMPGGRMTAQQYLYFDQLADRRANGSLRITTRQGIQFHGILKGDLKPAIAEINDTLLTTMSACGDVVRNIMASPTPVRNARQARIEADAKLLSEHLKPKSRAYYEIFLDEAPRGEDVDEPLYGPTYLPRKFKVGITHEADNTIDVLSNDLGIVAMFDGDVLRGYTIAIGGGLGMTHNNARTYPRLATPIAFVGPDDLIRIVEAVIKLQRDHGDRTNRRRARLKYVIDDKGLPWIRETLAAYYGGPLADPQPIKLARTGRRQAVAWRAGGRRAHRGCRGRQAAHGAARGRQPVFPRDHHVAAAGCAADRYREVRSGCGDGNPCRSRRGAGGEPFTDGALRAFLPGAAHLRAGADGSRAHACGNSGRVRRPAGAARPGRSAAQRAHHRLPEWLRAHLCGRYRHRRAHARILRALRRRGFRGYAAELQVAGEGAACRGDQLVRPAVRSLGQGWAVWRGLW
jgi:dissimilatory sulfite reductase (desulfoviridin) alpha/beta subunit